MALARELGFDECVSLLHAGVVGRMAVCTPDGPQIVPMNYSVAEGSMILATSPYSALGTYGDGNLVAFEVDHFDYDTHTGWSVVVRGRAQVLADPDEVARVRRTWPPRPWADGTRNLYVRIPWTELSGRSLGNDTTTEVRRIVTAL